MFNKLNHVSLFQPSAIDNSYSTIQIIHKLINNMNKVIDTINEMEDISVEKANDYTDEKIIEVNNLITEIDNRVSNIYDNVQDLNTLTNNLNNEVSELTGQISILANMIVEYADGCNSYTDYRVNALKNYIDDEIFKVKNLIKNLSDIEIYSSHTGMKEKISSYIMQDENRQSIVDNRFRFTWSNLINDRNRYNWLDDTSWKMQSGCNFFAPIWYNFLLPTKVNDITQLQTGYESFTVLNTWGSFCYNTYNYIAFLVWLVIYACAFNPVISELRTMYVYNYDEFSTYKYFTTRPETTPSIEFKDITNSITQGSSTKLIEYIRTNYISSLTKYVGVSSQIYSSSTSANNVLFKGTGDLPNLFTFLLGNLNVAWLSNTNF